MTVYMICFLASVDDTRLRLKLIVCDSEFDAVLFYTYKCIR